MKMKRFCAILLMVMPMATPLFEVTALTVSVCYIEVDFTNQTVTVFQNGNRTQLGIVRQMICSAATEAPSPTMAILSTAAPGSLYAVVKEDTRLYREKEVRDETLLADIPAGTIYDVLSMDSEWTAVRIDNDVIAYIPTQHVEIVKVKPVPTQTPASTGPLAPTMTPVPADPPTPTDTLAPMITESPEESEPVAEDALPEEEPAEESAA